MAPALAAGSAAFNGIANKQVIWIIVGMGALWVTVTFVRDLNLLRRYKYTFAIAGIALVAGRHARRVVLSGLPTGERLLAEAVGEGLEAGVRVRLDRGAGSPAALVLTPMES